MTQPPTPNNIPVPRPRPRPAAAAAPAPSMDEALAAKAAQWGRVDDEGNVWLRSSGSAAERIVGQYAAGGTEKDALGLYVRRFLDLQASVALLEARIDNLNPEEIKSSLATLNEQLVEPAVVGDVEALRERVTALETRAESRKEEVAAERAAAKAKALEERTALVERAEAISAQDPAKTHWRDSRAELDQLLDKWKAAQRGGARLDRPTEEALWKRFSHSRTQFDRHRRQFFSDLESERNLVTARKEALITRAEELSVSTEWGATSAAYRNLMDEWKAAGRSTKKDDDKLWERFRAAQQSFFDARNSFNSKVDEEYGANLEAKLALLAEAEKLVPVKNLDAAKAKIREIGEQWDAIGRVPRNDVSRTEGRMRDIEQATRDAESEAWKKSDPEKQERSNGMAEQLESLIAELEGQIADAKAGGNAKKVKELEEALKARQAWLKAVQDD